jgi:thymidine kinase
MFSGKSEELIRRLRNAQSNGRLVQAFKPAIDNRYSESEIVSHADIRMPCETAGCAYEIIGRLDAKTEVVGVDEPNFFGSELVPVAAELASNGKQVIIAGLDTDFLGRPFVPMPELLAIADVITKLHAVCARCGAAAKHSQRLLASRELILVGASGSYEARCTSCFEPGASDSRKTVFISSSQTPDMSTR